MKRWMMLVVAGVAGVGLCGPTTDVRTTAVAGAETPTATGPAQPVAPAAEATPAPAGAEVTLVGLALNQAHFGDKEKYVVFQAFDGTPEVKAEFAKIMAECYPEQGLDGDAARKLQDQIMARLKYSVEGPQLDALNKKVQYGAPILALTGVISEKDGKKTITVSKFDQITWGTSKNAKFSYPAKMLAPDKPFVMPDKEPLAFKLNDMLSLKCIYVPPGKFLMGEPFYQAPHWMEDPPHMVTLTKGYYMAESLISQEMFEAVAGYNPSKNIDPKCPVNVSCVDMYKFCQLLSEKTGRKVRIPTAAEWDYAGRVGTSNPPFADKYKAQNSSATKNASQPVKSKQPNAWGFYDMVSSGWERVSDGTSNKMEHEDTVDPQHIPPQDKAEDTQGRKHGHMGKGNAGNVV